MFAILTVIVLIVAIPFIAALFIRKEYLIQRELVIDCAPDQVFDYVRHLRNQDHFSKWVMTDPQMKKEFRGVDGTPGFVYAWDSLNKQAGKGEQEIVKIKDNRVDVQVRFEKPFKNTADTFFIIEPAATGSRVVWGMKGANPYPRNFINAFMDKLLGKDLEISLHNLKVLLERS